MPDPRGGARLLPYDCQVKYIKKEITIPIKIENPSDYAPGTHKARLVQKPVWLVEITMPKELMNEIRTGSVEFENETVDLGELDQSYEEDLDQEEFQIDDAAT